MPACAVPTLSFRPITDADRLFLTAVYASTREEELRQVDWAAEQKAAFVDMQFAAQHQHYQQHYTQADFLVILCNRVPCGRLYLARWSGEFCVVELTLLPAFRNLGLGTRLLAQILLEADAAEKPVRIHVEHNNPARHLYLRLGFVPIEDHGVHVLLERPHAGAPSTSPAGVLCELHPCTTA